MKKTAAFLSLLMLLLMLGGCKLVRIEEGERTSLKYTVVDHSQIPEQAADGIPEGRRPLSDKGIRKADEWRIQHSGDRSVGICERCFF